MFIKKDERKVPQILTEASAQAGDAGQESLTELRLARRPAEFNGSLSILCQPHYANALHNLTSLSLYDCQISTLSGIGYFASSCDNIEEEEGVKEFNEQNQNVRCPHLKELNFGRNPLKSLPSELSLLSNSLTSLWLDDCEITGPLPECVYDLENLEILRVSNNKITAIKGGLDGVVKWRKMKVLCLDGNMIEEIPIELAKLTHLESLLLRKNKLSSLPEGVPGITHTKLTLLHVSSNHLKLLPSSIVQCVSLTAIYANANQITAIPDDMAIKLTQLKSFNLCNNRIGSVGAGFVERFGEPDATSGTCGKVS